MTDPASTSPAPPADLSFGSGLAELDAIVSDLEGGQLELEESLARYERGVALLRALQDKLTDAQQRVTMLIGELESSENESSVAAPAPTDDGTGATEEEVPF
jgi:exodeoxyribonuclease VII small subunit